jgi:hypothetical protein
VSINETYNGLVALKLYIAYGAASDQVTALRLQALGAVNGLTVYAPPAYTRMDPAASLDSLSENNLREAQVVLGVITSILSESCRQELNTAKSLGKNIVVLAEPAVATQLERFFPGNILVIDPTEPAQAESGIVEFLKKMDLEQDAKTALIALGTLALGLLLFAPQDQ